MASFEMVFSSEIRFAFLATFVLLVYSQQLATLRQEVPIGSQVSFTCNSQDNLPVFWKVPPRNTIVRSGSLKVLVDKATKYGKYECYSEFPNGEQILGKTVEVIRPVTRLNVEKEMVFVSLNRPYTITCPYDFGAQNTNWLSFDKKNKVWIDRPNIKTTTYTIASVLISDITVWRCESANNIAVNNNLAATIVLTRGWATQPKSTLSAESEIQAEIHVLKDNTLKHTLECEPVGGRNGDQIMWEFKGNNRKPEADRINDGYVSVGNNTDKNEDDPTSNLKKFSAEDFSLLEINNCKTQNSGFYRCKLSDGSQRYARLQIRKPEPEIHNFGKQGQQRVESNVGESLTMHCFIERAGVQSSDLVWVFRPKGRESDDSASVEYRADEPEKNGVRIVTVSDRSRFLLSNVQSRHEGRYFCKYADVNDYTDLSVKGGRRAGQLKSREDFDVQLTITRSINFLQLRCSVTKNGVNEPASSYRFAYFEDVDGTEKPVSNSNRVPMYVSNDRNFLCKATNIANNKVVPSALNKVAGVTLTLTSATSTGMVVQANLTLRCVASDPAVNVRQLTIDFNYGRPLPVTYSENTANFNYGKVTKRQAGTYRCALRGSTLKSNDVKIVVCDGKTELLCRDMLLCYPRGKNCDGNQDCADGSDEDRNQCMDCEPHSLRCQTLNGVAPEMKCVLKHWVCDGQNDCGNDWDEFVGNGYCNKHPIPTQNCNGCGRNETCCSDGKCFPRAFECDNEADCSVDRIDESTCTCGETSQLELDNPLTEMIISTTSGSNVELTCQVRAKERPTINWRFNWGHLPDEVRMIESMTTEQVFPEGATGAAESYTVKGKLVISNVNPKTDLGRYTCEAVTKCKRRLVPDYILRLETITDTPPF